MQLLIIDPDSLLSSHLKRLQEGVSCTVISDLSPSSIGIKEKNYPPVLFVFNEIGQEEKACIEALKEAKKEAPFALALLTDDATQGASCHCDYLLTSWDKEDIDLLITLLEQESKGPISDDAAMEEIFLGYRRSIFEKIRTLEELLKQVDEKGDLEAIQNLRNAVHKLAGNAGSYGYGDVTTICKEWEARLNPLLADPTKIPSGLPSKEEGAELLLKIKQGFTKKETREPVSSPPPPSAPAPSSGLDLCVIDDDLDLLALIQAAAKKQGLSIRVESDFKKGEELLQDPSFNPKVLLLDLSFPETPLTGFDLLHTFNAREPRPMGTLVGILSAKGEMGQRMQASQEKADLYFQKPLAPDQLITHIRKLTEIVITKKTNILLLDDDENFCSLMQASLQSSVYNLKFLTESSHLFEEIETFAPELLLLDIHLATQNGIDILRSLHTDYRFRSLPVVIISIEKEIEVINEALLEGAVGYLFKPITPDALKHFLEQFFRKQECRNVIYEKDTLLEVCTKQALIDTFNALKIKFATFPIATFHLLFAENTTPNQKQSFNKKVARLLNLYFGKKDVIGTWNREFFVLLITDFNLIQLKSLLFTLFEQLRQENTLEGGTLFSTLTLYPRDGTELEQVIQKGQALQTETKDIQPWTALLKDPEEEFKQEDLSGIHALLISSNPILCNILQYSLELRGVITRIIAQGEVALKWLTQHFLKEGPDLILLDSDLSNEDPMIVLDRLKNLVGNRIPIIMLSSLTKEGDITEGLKRGASNYIVKPFSLNIFMQTFEQTLR